jgi:hypothetical protein
MCGRHDQERSAMRPQEAALQKKLFGDLNYLRKTTTFIADTGVIAYSERQEEEEDKFLNILF